MVPNIYTSLLLAAGAYQGFCLTAGLIMLVVLPRVLTGRNTAALRMGGIAIMLEGGVSIFTSICANMGLPHDLVLDLNTLTGLLVIAALTLLGRSLTVERMPHLVHWLQVIAPFVVIYIISLIWPEATVVCSVLWVLTACAFIATSHVIFLHHDRKLKEEVANLENQTATLGIIFLVLLFAAEAVRILTPLVIPRSDVLHILYFAYMTVVWLFLIDVLVRHRSIGLEMEPAGPGFLFTTAGRRLASNETLRKAMPRTAHRIDMSDPAAAVFYDEDELLSLGEKLRKAEAGSTFYLDPEINRDALAKQLGVSRQQLSAYLSLARHETFFDYVNGLRTEHAKRLLKDAGLTLEDVAQQCGYESVRSFERAFRKIAGVAPGEWRK